MPSMEAKSWNTFMNTESSSSSVSQLRIFLRMWVESLLTLSLEVDETSSVRFSSVDLDLNILLFYGD